MTDECTVCFTDDWITKTKCNHLICLTCLFKLPTDECPICRRPIQNTLPFFLRQFMKCTNRIQKRIDIESFHEFPSL